LRVLKGAFTFLADLVRKFDIPLTVRYGAKSVAQRCGDSGQQPRSGQVSGGGALQGHRQHRQGVCRGLGLKMGALAASVAHDVYNIVAVGIEDSDIFVAVTDVEANRGGLAVVADGCMVA